MKYLAYVLLFLVMVLPVLLGVFWLMWQAWVYVANALGAPDKLANPTYWTFVIAWMLLAMFASLFRSKK